MTEHEKGSSDVINGGVTWPKLMTVLLTVMVGTMGSNVAFRIADPPRNDPFTGKDANVMRLELEREDSLMERRIMEKIDEGQRQKPPSATRSRIMALESAIDKCNPDYEKPTEDWQ